jgi:carboxymethylenebutenolidase
VTTRLLPTKGQAALLLIHSWWGLSAGTRVLGERFRSSGVNVMLADLYGGRIATSQAEAQTLRSAKRAQPMYRDLLDDISILKAKTGAARVAVLGLSMGGHWAIWLAQNASDDIAACITFYAVRGGTFDTADCAFQMHFADTDPFVSAAAKRRMLGAIRSAAHPLTVFDYPGTGHWFAESDRPEYNAAATQVALDRILCFLNAAPGLTLPKAGPT